MCNPTGASGSDGRRSGIHPRQVDISGFVSFCAQFLMLRKYDPNINNCNINYDNLGAVIEIAISIVSSNFYELIPNVVILKYLTSHHN